MSRTRGTWNTKGTWLAGGALVALLALTGYAMLGGDGDSDPDAAGRAGARPGASSTASPVPSYQAPEDWTEPERWTALPRGAETDRYGSEVGFPHTTEGAVAMLAAANSTVIEDDRDTAAEQMRIYRSYVARSDQSPDAAERIELGAIETDKRLHEQMGTPAGQALPPGAYVRNTVIGYKVVLQSENEVGAWLLARAVMKRGESAKESAGYTRVLVGAVWQDGDWRLSGSVTQKVRDASGKRPTIAAPGDPAFNAAGWTAIREAS
ncbi:hypothetical protein [Streptomyces sp. NPDC053367]|uniref:hypothetical protein n=1 Tax=Streptomyces sp. NPDC053367 TaxID=3365700 RepID=UPI0037D87355